MGKLLASTSNANLTASFVLEIMRHVYLTRSIDDKCAILAKQNKGGTFYLSANSHELIGVVGGLLFRSGENWAFPYYRDRGYVIGRGCPPEGLFASFLARDHLHHSGGRQMPEHYCDPTRNIALQSSVVGSQCLQAVGLAKARQLRGEKGVVYVSFGDGATSQGDFHEALNFATIHHLPVIFVLQDNGWAISVSKEEQTSGGTIVPMAQGYAGLNVLNIDGTNIEEVFAAYQNALFYAHEGPSLIVAHVPRLGPHSSSDNPQKYQSPYQKSMDILRDPLFKLQEWIIEQGIIDHETLKALQDDVKVQIDKAAAVAEALPEPEEVDERDVFAPSNLFACVHPLRGDNVIMATQLNHALCEEMARDDRIVVFGEDVAGGKGGVFGITEGLSSRFGQHRCFNTPLAESTIVGTALGMALEKKIIPVGEIQFVDYFWTGANQLFNEIATYYFRSNGAFSLPLVLRMPCGGYIQGGPFHSHSLEAIFAHIPGLKVVMPSTAADAKRLLKGAIRDPNPVIFLEHKALYRQHTYAATPEPAEDEVLPLGEAKVVCEGEALTIVTWGMMVMWAVEVVKELDIDVEIIDLRTIVPYDKQAIARSVQKTGKLLVMHESPRHGGFGAEIAAEIAETVFHYLDAPPKRLGGLFIPVAYNKTLESMTLPQRNQIRQAVKALYDY